MGWQDAPHADDGKKPKWAEAEHVDQPKRTTYTPSELMLSKATWQLSDKARAGASALIDAGVDKVAGRSGRGVSDLVTGKRAPTLGDRYDQSLSDIDAARGAFKDKHPGFDWGTLPMNLVGALPKSAELLLAKVGGGALRKAAASGAVYGAVAGAGQSRGSVGDQAKQIAASAAFGAGAGPIAAKAVPWLVQASANAAAPAARAANSLLRRYQAPAEDAVAEGIQNVPSPKPAVRKIIQQTLASQGMTPRQAGKMIDEARGRGVPLALMDTGDEMRGLASALARKPGANRTIMRDSVVGRQEGQIDRVQGAINRDLGPVANVREASENLIKGAREKAAPLYENAYAQPIPETTKLAELALRPSMRNALSRAYKIAAEEGRDPKAMGFNLDAEGNVALEKHNSTQTWDYVKRGLDDVIESARDPVTGRLKMDEGLRAINGTQREFLKEMDRVNPAYGEARAAYSGPAKMASALAKGSKIGTRDAETVWAETRDLPPAELEQYKLGVRSALTKMLEGKPDDANKVRALVGTPKKRAVLSQLFGGEKNFDRFMTTLADEQAAALTHGRVNTGSMTAHNLSDDAALDGAGGVMANMARRALSGQGMIRNGLSVAGDVMKHGSTKSAEMVRAQLASGLSETDPVVLAARLREISRANALKRLTKSKAVKRGPKSAAGGGIASGTFADWMTGDGN